MRAGDITARLAQGVVLGDGGYLLELERRGYVGAGAFTPEVVLEHPDVVVALHTEFRRAGAEVLQALTFYGDDETLTSVGQRSQTAELNRTAVRLARQAAGADTLVAGVITQTRCYAKGDPDAARRARRLFAEQVTLQREEGVDFLIGETFRYLSEALLALEVIVDSGLTAMITVNAALDGSADGVPPGECARRLADAGAAVVGVNCNYGPVDALAIATAMVDAVPGTPVACQPVAYRTGSPNEPFTALPEFPLALDTVQLGRHDLADFATAAAEAGVRYIGGCCGVTAHHVRAMAEALGRSTESSAKSPDLTRHVIPAVRARAAARGRSPALGALPAKYRELLLADLEPGETYRRCLHELADDGLALDYGVTETVVYATEVRYALSVLRETEPPPLWNFGDVDGCSTPQLYELLDTVEDLRLAFVGTGPYPITALLVAERYPLSRPILCVENNIVAFLLGQAVIDRVGAPVECRFAEALDVDYAPYNVVVVAAMVRHKGELVRQVVGQTDGLVVVRGELDFVHERVAAIAATFADDGALRG